jgi:hypothetical protein
MISMITIDIASLFNWIVMGLIGVFFGTISAWIAYRYERRRDDIVWEREKIKLHQQYEQEKELLALQNQQKVKELEEQIARQNSSEVRQELLRGLDNPDETVRKLLMLSEVLQQQLHVEDGKIRYMGGAGEEKVPLQMAIQSAHILQDTLTRISKFLAEWSEELKILSSKSKV